MLSSEYSQVWNHYCGINGRRNFYIEGVVRPSQICSVWYSSMNGTILRKWVCWIKIFRFCKFYSWLIGLSYAKEDTIILCYWSTKCTDNTNISMCKWQTVTLIASLFLHITYFLTSIIYLIYYVIIYIISLFRRIKRILRA